MPKNVFFSQGIGLTSKNGKTSHNTSISITENSISTNVINLENTKLKISDFKQEVPSKEMRRIFKQLAQTFTNLSDPAFLALFDKREILFVEDGYDLNRFEPQKNTGKQICIDINPFLIKYDYEIARKINHLIPAQLELLKPRT